MPRTTLVCRHDLERRDVEEFIRAVYATRYHAKVAEFPSRLIATRNRHSEIVCAAGLRSEKDGFFSEAYLDEPIDRLLADLYQEKIDREEILEISTLSLTAAAMISGFIGRIVAFGAANGYSWAFFTATARLHRFVENLGFSTIRLAAAERSRVPNPEGWGTYYSTNPAVYAIRGWQQSAISPPLLRMIDASAV